MKKERKYTMEIEGLMVEITYEYQKGSKGDYWVAPSEDRVKILYWELVEGQENAQEENELSDDAWDAWMFDIEEYVDSKSEWDIIEHEHELEDSL